MFKKTSGIIFIFLFLFNVTKAEAIENSLKAFRQLAKIKLLSITIPTVEELKLSSISANGLAVWDKNEGKFVPSKIFNQEEVFLTVQSNTNQNVSALVDNDLNTSVFFNTDGYSLSLSEINLNINPVSRVKGIRIILDKNVALPNYIYIYDDINKKTLVACKKVTSSTIYFPQTVTSKLIIRLEHIQPLQIAEIKILGDFVNYNKKFLRFLAQPNHQYLLYLNPAYNPQIKFNFSEYPNLDDNKSIKTTSLEKINPNPYFQEPDSDKDGVIDRLDNCVKVPNPDQKDENKNGLGDACDDFDKDGIINSKDNCPNKPNKLQKDKDRDGIGDVCDNKENRFTERNPWVIWAAMGLVLITFILMSTIVIKMKNQDKSK